MLRGPAPGGDARTAPQAHPIGSSGPASPCPSRDRRTFSSLSSTGSGSPPPTPRRCTVSKRRQASQPTARPQAETNRWCACSRRKSCKLLTLIKTNVASMIRNVCKSIFVDCLVISVWFSWLFFIKTLLIASYSNQSFLIVFCLFVF